MVEKLDEYGAGKAILFGSAARGDVDHWSDIDLVVIKRTDKRFLDRLMELGEVLAPNYALDLLVYTPEEFEQMVSEERPFIMRVLEEGRVIYERSKG